MTNLNHYHEADFIHYCQQALQEFARRYRGIDMLLLTTPAGFEIASYANSGLYNRSKLAAFGSSLFKISNSMTQASRLSPCESLLLDSSNGKIYISSIVDAQHPVVLVIKTNPQATLGNMMHGANRLNEKIKIRLETGEAA